MSHINQQRRIEYKHYKSTPNFRSCINKKKEQQFRSKQATTAKKSNQDNIYQQAQYTRIINQNIETTSTKHNNRN